MLTLRPAVQTGKAESPALSVSMVSGRPARENRDNVLKMKGLFVDVDHSVDSCVARKLELRPTDAVSLVGQY